MTRSFEKSIKVRLIQLAKLLGVNDYSFRLSIGTRKKDSPDYDSYGYVRTDEETRSVAMFLNKRFLVKEPAETDNTITHELLHVRMNELMSLINDIITKHVSDKRAQAVYTTQLEKMEHKIILALTNAIKRETNG